MINIWRSMLLLLMHHFKTTAQRRNKNNYGWISSGNKSPSVEKLRSAFSHLFYFPDVDLIKLIHLNDILFRPIRGWGGGCFWAWPMTKPFKLPFCHFCSVWASFLYGGRNVSYFKILEFRQILSFFGPVAAILNFQDTSLRGLQCSNKKVCLAKVVRSSIL